MPLDIFVVSTEAPEGERFAILRHEDMPFSAAWFSLGDMRAAMERFLASVPVVTETDARAQLAAIGLESAAVDRQIRRARNMQAVNASMPTTWERTTSVGYTNNQRQEVIRKTSTAGTVPGQRVYVLRCGECGYEYGANGSEIHNRRCPSCQGGPPGLASHYAMP